MAYGGDEVTLDYLCEGAQDEVVILSAVGGKGTTRVVTVAPPVAAPVVPPSDTTMSEVAVALLGIGRTLRSLDTALWVMVGILFFFGVTK